MFNSALFGTTRAGVPRSAEFLRIWNLPSRTLDRPALVQPWTEALKTTHGSRTLFADQAATLYSIANAGSAVVALRPGAGKTTIGALAGTVAGAKRPLYLCEASAKQSLLNALPVLRAHWKLPAHLTVCAYSELSSKSGRRLLEALKPDLVVADEAQKLKNEMAARTSRFLEYFVDNPSTIFIPMSGSFTVKGLSELYHLFREALGDKSPVPTNLEEAKLWSEALGSAVEDHNRVGLGALAAFADFLEPAERNGDRLTQARKGLRRRMELTDGVVLSTRGLITLPLSVKSPEVEVPPKVQAAFKHLHDTWELGDEEFTDRVEFAGAARTLICGFYYKWVWPNKERNERWIEARKNWHKYVRNIVLYEKKKYGLDTKGLVEDACRAFEAYEIVKRSKDPAHANLRERLAAADVIKLNSPEYRTWKEVEPEYRIVTEAVWLDEYLVDYAVAWTEQNDGVVWVPYVAFGEKLRERGVRYFGGGDNEIEAHRGSCAASIASHHHSKNLQHWHRCLYLLPPGNGLLAEQSLARFHRYGQEHPVEADMLVLCRASMDAWTQALKDAKYAQDINSDQLLCAADLSGVLTEDRIKNPKDALWKA